MFGISNRKLRIVCQNNVKVFSIFLFWCGSNVFIWFENNMCVRWIGPRWTLNGVIFEHAFSFMNMHSVLCYFQLLAHELHTRHPLLFLKISNKCIFSNYLKFDECPSCSSYSKIRFMHATITNFPIGFVLKLEEYILLSVNYCYISFHLKLRNINNVSVDISY